MRALLVEFERGIDPKEAMSIGRLANIPMEKIHNAAACARNYSFDDLQNIYEKIRSKKNIKLDGIPVEDLPYNDWVTFNNKVVNGIKALRRKKTKTQFQYSEGELLKVQHEGKTYLGRYKGVDRNGRIQAIGHQTKLAFSPEKYSRATDEEKETFIRQGIALEKRKRKNQIEKLKWRLDQAPNSVFLRTELEAALRNYENTFKEKYNVQP